MKEFLEIVSEEMKQAFEKAGYPAEYGKVNVSNRPDLCELQCNGAMALAKQFKKAPIMIANAVADALADSKVFSKVEAVMPGFLNCDIAPEFLASYLQQMEEADKFGLEKPEKIKKIVIDYGGPNVAKPLHVGHLRSAVIGESVKRIARYMGHNVTGDIHMGDWGLQMGLIITELQERKPELVYLLTQVNIRRKRRLRSLNWKKSIRQPAADPRKILPIKKKQWKQRKSCKTAYVGIVLSGIISFPYLSVI